jgi:glycosyltransferase involved in cell wall biosynthesis
LQIALDATYSLDENLSGIGVYSRELLHGMAAAHPEAEFLWCYRPHRLQQSWQETLPHNCRRKLLQEPLAPRRADLFHGLNQRLPRARFRHTVTTFHDLFVLTGEYSTPEFRRRFAEQARQAAGAEAIVTVSEFTARQVHDLLGVERSRIHVVHHGVRRAVMDRTETGADRERLILHVGAIQRRKNILRLVEAFEKVNPSWRLVLAGSAGFGADEILRRVESSTASARIEVPGYVTAERLATLYARAGVFAFPSLDEGFGMPVLEAMAYGVPVLTSNRSALPEVAGDAALLVDPEDNDAVTEGLQQLTKDAGLRARLTERGRQRAQIFSWKAAIDKTWQVYREVLNEVRRLPRC